MMENDTKAVHVLGTSSDHAQTSELPRNLTTAGPAVARSSTSTAVPQSDPPTRRQPKDVAPESRSRIGLQMLIAYSGKGWEWTKRSGRHAWPPPRVGSRCVRDRHGGSFWVSGEGWSGEGTAQK